MKEPTMPGMENKGEKKSWEDLSKVEKTAEGYKANSRFIRYEILKQLGEQMVNMAETFKDERTSMDEKANGLHITDRVHVQIPMDEKYSLGNNFSLKEFESFDLNLPERFIKFIESGQLDEIGFENEAGYKVSATLEGDNLIIKNEGAF
ncbi:MAG: hypothetical protein WCV70_02920 [Patescibacteria group bacterium]|jgi:hypothetical protein